MTSTISSPNCQSPFTPIPSGYTTAQYQLIYDINGSVIVPKYYTTRTTNNIITPAVKIGKGRSCTPSLFGKQICQSYPYPYIDTGTLKLTIGSFQLTPDFLLSASGTMETNITTGTKLEQGSGPTSLPTVITIANLDIKPFTLNLTLQNYNKNRSGLFDNYGFNINIPLNFTQTLIVDSNDTNIPTAFPGLVANFPPNIPLEPITIRNAINPGFYQDLLISTNLVVNPTITSGNISMSWVYCVQDGVLTIGGVATVTMNIIAPGTFAPNPLVVLGKSFRVRPVSFSTYSNTITTTLPIPATTLTITNTSNTIPGPPLPSIPETQSIPETPSVPSLP
jgi:hypothetical protein